MNDASILQLKVDGEPGTIELKALEKSCSAMIKLIRAVEGKDAQPAVKELSTGSVVVDIALEEHSAQIITHGLDALSQGQQPAAEFNRHALAAVNELYAVNACTGVTGVQCGKVNHLVSIDASVEATTIELLSSQRRSLGSVSGVLYKYNSRTDVKAGLLHSRTGKSVELELEQEHVKTVLACMDSEVRVRGLLVRDPVTNEVLKVKVKEVVKVPDRSIQQPAWEVQGVLGADWLDGAQPADVVRQARGA